jgi:Ca2+-transporting ATPase
VYRNGVAQIIPTAAIVINDLVEGNTINADGEIVHSNDFSVNESSLTVKLMGFKSDKVKTKSI